jgi:hypothetical protein
MKNCLLLINQVVGKFVLILGDFVCEGDVQGVAGGRRGIYLIRRAISLL